MASTYSKLKIELIGTGDQAGQWGTTTNNNLGSSSAGVYRGLEQAIVGMATISSGFVANSYTLPYTNSNDDQEFRCLVLNITASLSNPSDLIVPAIQKPYIVINSSGQTVTVKVSGQTGVAVPNGAKILLYNTGTDVGTAVTYLTELKLGGNLTMPSAGSINDSNGNELIKFPSAVASAVNELTISNAATGSAPTLSATGGDTNIGITLTPKGTGTLFTAGNVSFDGGTFVFNESGADKDFRIEGDTEPNLFFTDASTDRVGIGTSSPQAPLHVKGTTNGNLYVRAASLAESGLTGLGLSAVNDAASDLAAMALQAKSFNIVTDNTVRATLDNSGNLALGVTPSAWSSMLAFQVRGASFACDANTHRARVFTNTYFDGVSYKYIQSSGALMYLQNSASSGHSWYYAPSGFGYGTAATSLTSTQNGNSYTIVSAGTTDFTLIGAANNNVGTTFTKSGGTGTGTGTVSQPVTFTQAMTLDASGNLLIGATANIGSGRQEIVMRGANGSLLSLGNNTTADRFQIASDSGPNALLINKANTPMIFYTDNTERARITSGGDLLVGTSVAFLGSARATIAGVTPSSTAEPYLVFIADTRAYNSTSPAAGGGLGFAFKYDAAGNYAGGTGIFGFKENTSDGNYAGALSFYTRAHGNSATERARITSGGDLLVGTTNASLQAGGVRLKNGGGNLGEIALANNSGVSDYVARFLWGTTPTLVGNITVSSTATAFNTSSDRRLKKNIAPADDASAIIDAIEIVKHDWKTGGHTRFGVIAQDLNAAAPEAVSAGDDGDEVERTWSVDYSKLVPMLIKEIQSLRARVAALEGTQP